MSECESDVHRYSISRKSPPGNANMGIADVAADINAYVNGQIAMMDPFNSPSGRELENAIENILLAIAKMVAVYDNLQETKLLSDQKEGPRR